MDATHPPDPFPATRWSIVALSARRDSRQARTALAELCQIYWYPLYAFVRRRGHTPHEAEDLTQSFFALLLEKRWLDAVDRDRGRFRAFLLAAIKHFLANERDKAMAQKRGGGQALISLDANDAEARYRREPADPLTPEKLFARRWAETLLAQVLSGLEDEFAAAGRAAQFAALKPFLTVERGSISHAEVAARLGTTAAAAKVAVHRLRCRYRDRLRAEIAQTVTGPEEVDEELRALFSAFA